MYATVIAGGRSVWELLEEVIVKREAARPLPSVREWYWFRNLQEGMLATEYVSTADSISMPLRRTMPTKGPLHRLDLYAGGFEGWQVATSCLGTVLLEASIETVAVEHSLPLACVHALSHSAILVYQKGTHGCKWPCPCLVIQRVEWNGVASFLISLPSSPLMQGHAWQLKRQREPQVKYPACLTVSLS